MLPTLKDGDKVLVIRHYPKSWIKKNDIVLVKPVFKNSNSDYSQPFVKRVIGTQDDIINVQVNDFGVGKNDQDAEQLKKFIIPKGHVFVQGDSIFSTDSREWGPIPISNIIGIVVFHNFKIK